MTTAFLSPESIVEPRSISRPRSGIDHVADHLTAEFDGALPKEVIHRVTLSARRDLEREVPSEALAEFTHRVSRQRLVDLLTLEQQLPGTEVGAR